MNQEPIQSQENHHEVRKKRDQGLKIFIGTLVIVGVVMFSIFYITREPALDQSPSPATSALSPDTVLAVVNGEKILQETINLRISEAEQILSSQGVNLNDPNVRAQIEQQILDDTIGYILLKQGATESGVSADPKTLEETYQSFVDQAGSEEQFIAQLQQAGLTEDEFKKRLTEQLIIDAYLNDKVDTSGIEVTEDEIKSFYDTAIPADSEGAPSFDDVRDQITEQLRQQKEQELFVAFVVTLRESAVIELN